MNISYNWLKEYLEFDLTPQEAADALTATGLEAGTVEEIQSVKGGLEGLVIGEVLTSEKHPNSDHLSLTTVNVGEGEPLNIVCGAPNVAAGQKVVVATVGTTLYAGEQEFTIKRSKIRGEESHGMICAENEIGIGTADEGIIVLPETAQVGTLAKDYYNVQSDHVIEIDLTPNRSDGTSHYGVARDLAAWLQQEGRPYKLTQPSVEAFKIDNPDGGIDVEIADTQGCPRYSGLTLRGVTVQESPDWLKNHLQNIGIRPINNIVDISNFVLHETGHPMHIFDAAKIKGNKVVVRTTPAKTKFVTLDEVERELHEADLMICDAEEAICIAGVFGGLDSGVTEATTDLFLESAYFHPTRVRKTARRHGLNTDASFRFERGADPNNTIYVLKRAALLIQELAGGTIEGEIRDVYPEPIERPTVQLTYNKVNSVIGKEITPETVKSILNSLDIEIENETNTELTLRIPTYRADVYRNVDVIEEILRIYGYNNIDFSEQVQSNLSYQTPTDRKYKLQTLISEQLTAGGFYEIMNNSLTKRSYYEENDLYPIEHSVPMLNPLSNDLGVMRQTLLYGGLESIAYNRNRQHSDLRFYEFGNVYHLDADKKRDDQNLAQFTESHHAALWITGRRNHKNWSANAEQSTVFELKGYVLNILSRIGINERQVRFEPVQNNTYSSGMHITLHNGTWLGSFGVVTAQLRKKFDIESEVYFAELQWDLLMNESARSNVRFKELSKFPTVSRDFALLIDQSVTFAQIEQIARKADRKLLKDVVLFDVYEGDNLPEGKKSYAVNFILGDDTKTLKDKQIDAVMNKIRHNLEKQLGATLR